jgi:hypothetical protein
MGTTEGKWVAVAAIVSAIASLACAPAGAATGAFGADLNQEANNTVACNDQLIGSPFANPGYTTCMWTSLGGTESFYGLAESGTVTAVRVKVGARTGPMQVVVIRSYFRNTFTPGKPELACCVMQQYGPVFTPQANAVTTVATSLAMTEQHVPPPEDMTTIATADELALAVLGPNVPVPASANGGRADFAWYPAPSQAGVPAPSPDVDQYNWDFSGLQVLMNADYEAAGAGGATAPTGGGAPAPAPATPVAPALPSIALPKLTIPVKGNTATVPIQCLVVDCAGILNLQSAQLAGTASVAANHKKKKPKVLSYGTASFSLKAGTTGKVKVKLNAAGRKLVKAHKKSKVWANVRFTSGGGKPKSALVTLKR